MKRSQYRPVPNLIEEAAEDARREREAIQWVERQPWPDPPPEPKPAPEPNALTPANWQAALDHARLNGTRPDPQGRLFR